MALIECKFCGKQVSDKAKICPNCGEVLIPEEIPEVIKCIECGCDIPDGADLCPNCGCPVRMEEDSNSPQKVEVTKVSVPVNKKKILKIVIVLFIVIAIIAAIIFATLDSKSKKIKENYLDNFDLCISSMYLGAVQAESANSLIHDVWYDTIYENWESNTYKFTHNSFGSFNYDFNDSLKALFNDTSFKSDISSIKTNQDLVASLMKELKNPPDEYVDAYDALKDLYEAYCDLTECAVNPSGSLSSYTSACNTADSEFVKYYKAANLYQ